MQANAPICSSHYYRLVYTDGAQPEGEEHHMSEQVERPTTEDREAWKTYWATQGLLWRTEPEIDHERQAFLAERRAIRADVMKSIYPFSGIQLTRADVEWLLATHESGGRRGPVDWEDATERKRAGLDLRAADLRTARLSHLPLARLRGGLVEDEFRAATLEQLEQAAIHLDGALLAFTDLQGSILTFAHLEGVDLQSANLEDADLYRAHLEADVPANLRRASFSSRTVLNRLVLANPRGEGPYLGDVRWNGAILTGVEWARVQVLGEEVRARQRGTKRSWDGPLGRVPAAVRANRQLAVDLRTQGLNEEANGFAYRAQVLQRQVLRRQGHWLRSLGSLLLDLSSGYGYRPLRSLMTYLLVVTLFGLAYWALGVSTGHTLTWNEAGVVSLTAFHGRGFFALAFTPGDPQAALAALEAVLGLLIEIIFIATFTQRFFAR
jgi:uncharacterized protein YjbI with pentapeptide repeats